MHLMIDVLKKKTYVKLLGNLQSQHTLIFIPPATSQCTMIETFVKEQFKKYKCILRKAAIRNDLGQTQTEVNKEDNLKLIKELYELGLTQQKIADEMQISLRQVQNYCKELREQGLITSRRKKR